MSETMADELGSLKWSPTTLSPTVGPPDEWRAATTLGPSELPVMRAGQLWLVECPAAAPEFAPLEHRALRGANVVIYDRALAPTVARLLPLGGYAEPVVSGDGHSGADPIVASVSSATAGAWLDCSIPAFGPAGSGSTKSGSYRIACSASRRSPICQVQIFVSRGQGRYERKETQLSRLDAILARYVPSSTFTIVLDMTDIGVAPRFSVASANGLAG